MTITSLGQSIDKLAATIDARAGDDPNKSYTAQLLQAGPATCAKKLGEEAVEAAIAASTNDRHGLAHEGADVIYHLLVTLKACGVSPNDVAAELERRTLVSGLDEKMSR